MKTTHNLAEKEETTTPTFIYLFNKYLLNMDNFFQALMYIPDTQTTNKANNITVFL